MNSKISSLYSFSIEMGLISALFAGLANGLILKTSKNASLISILLGFILGLIPVLMIILISKKVKDQCLKEYIIKKFGILGHILNIFLIIVALFILFLNSWLIIDFMISQFLMRTSYYFIAIIFFGIIAFVISKGMEVSSRTIFILLFMALIIIGILWFSLFSYIKLDNLKPYIDVSKTRILKSSFIFMSYTSLPIVYILDLKHIVSDKQNFEKNVLLSYIFSFCIIFIFLFLIISIYTIDIATILTYPVYSLFKKVQIIGFVERIENFAAINIVIFFFAQATYLLYYLIKNISEYFKLDKIKKNIATYLLSIIIPIISIALFKNYNLTFLLNKSPYIISSLLIVIILLFLSSIKKKSL